METNGKQTNADGEILVTVRRQWNDWRTARYRMEDFASPHWSNISGGVGAKSPRFFIHGYVMCDGEVDGELPHRGVHGPCPHRIKVCVVAKDNTTEVIDTLKSEAGERPAR
jgi:hypothetical protein